MRFADIKQRFQVVKRFIERPLGPDAEPLEICAAVVDTIEDKVEAVGDGRRALPYNRIVVRVLARTRADRPPLDRALAELEAKVRERLQEIRCEPPGSLALTVSFLKKAPPDWADRQLFSVDCQDRPGTKSERSSLAPPSVRVDVVKGTGAQKVYSFNELTILMGRTPTVKERSGRERRNHIAFADADSSVSRAHARLKYDPARRMYRLLDEGSVHGTLVVRGGEVIHVPRRDPRGVLVLSGDEIQLGDASIRLVVG